MSRTLHILYVDDNPGDLRLVEEMLGDLLDDATFYTYTDAEEALPVLEREPIDCVISDYDMPGTGGLEFLREVRNRYSTVPFILFTGKGSEEVASEAISAGVTDYQPKNGPETYELLANRVAHAVEGEETKAELDRVRRRFLALAENTPFAVITVTEDETIEFANTAVEPIFGYEPAELVGGPLERLIPERLREDHRLAMERYLETGERTLDWDWIEFPGLHRDGHEIPLGITFGEAIDDDGRLFSAVVRDLSD